MIINFFVFFVKQILIVEKNRIKKQAFLKHLFFAFLFKEQFLHLLQVIDLYHLSLMDLHQFL